MEKRAAGEAPGSRAHHAERNGAAEARLSVTGQNPEQYRTATSSRDAQPGDEATGAVDSRQSWIVAASLFIALFFLWGGGYNTGPIFLAALLKAFGWSHARVGMIIGALALAVGISAPVAGWLLDRIEARWVMGTGAVVAVFGLLGASNSTRSEGCWPR
jgi:Major Facilitator Superfamily